MVLGVSKLVNKLANIRSYKNGRLCCAIIFKFMSPKNTTRHYE